MVLPNRRIPLVPICLARINDQFLLLPYALWQKGRLDLCEVKPADRIVAEFR